MKDMKDALTFLDELDNLLSKYHGENWQWKFDKLGGGFEILLTIDEEDKDDLN